MCVCVDVTDTIAALLLSQTFVGVTALLLEAVRGTAIDVNASVTALT